MHPVIRIVCLVALGTLISLSAGRAILFAVAMILAGYVATSTVHLAPAGRMLRRMRWLFISIIVFYFWFTPGVPLIDVESSWIPTWDGVRIGSTRIIALVTLVLAVNLLLQTTSRDAMVGALLWLTRPLRWLGLPHERFAVRLTLVFDAVRAVQGLYSLQTQSTKDARSTVNGLGERVANLFVAVLQHAERATVGALSINTSTRPPWYEWMYPLVGSLAIGLVLYTERIG